MRDGGLESGGVGALATLLQDILLGDAPGSCVATSARLPLSLFHPSRECTASDITTPPAVFSSNTGFPASHFISIACLTRIISTEPLSLKHRLISAYAYHLRFLFVPTSFLHFRIRHLAVILTPAHILGPVSKWTATPLSSHPPRCRFPQVLAVKYPRWIPHPRTPSCTPQSQAFTQITPAHHPFPTDAS